jgi:LAO/AO transport system kinase
MEFERIKEEVLKKSKNNIIFCKQCHEIADDLKVTLKEVGEAADELKIKIRNCQLGCFE